MLPVFAAVTRDLTGAWLWGVDLEEDPAGRKHTIVVICSSMLRRHSHEVCLLLFRAKEHLPSWKEPVDVMCTTHSGSFRTLSDYPPLPLAIAVNYEFKLSKPWCSICTMEIFTSSNKDLLYVAACSELRIGQSHLKDQVGVCLHTDSLMAATTLCDRRDAWGCH